VRGARDKKSGEGEGKNCEKCQSVEPRDGFWKRIFQRSCWIRQVEGGGKKRKSTDLIADVPRGLIVSIDSVSGSTKSAVRPSGIHWVGKWVGDRDRSEESVESLQTGRKWASTKNLF